MTNSDSPNDNGLRRYFGDAASYWEKRRFKYNLVLAGMVIAWFTLTWPHFRPALNLQSLGLLIVLGALANVCYSAAYLIDIPMQYSAFKLSWRRNRQMLWFIGLVLAIILTNYWIADEIYPFVD